MLAMSISGSWENSVPSTKLGQPLAPDFMPGYRLPPWGSPPPAPLAPLATVRVHGQILGHPITEPVQALLDSGADYTEIPIRLAQKLRLRKAGQKQVAGRPKPDTTYYAGIELEGRVFDVVVIASDQFDVEGEPWALIGRDILNEAVVLDGPGRAYTVAPATPVATEC
jgi:predicted aspartyl protease